jgi:hypothetical protein
VSGSDRLYQIDGRDAAGTPQGTAVLAPTDIIQPQRGVACPSGAATFSIATGGNPGPFAFTWQVHSTAGWQDLGNDPAPLPCGGSAFAFPLNAPTVQIGIRPCPGVDQYQVRCIVTDPCGIVTSGEVTYFVCRVDFDCSGAVNSQDFFDFLNAFFFGDSSADFNDDGAVNSQDLFDFLSSFFPGC